MRVTRRVLPALVVLLVLAAPAVASAAEPPNQNDPCARAGRDTCGTTGKGSYRTYKFGPRWFGDFRGAVRATTARRSASTCASGTRRAIPLREACRLRARNRDGDDVSASNLRRMNYAMWAFGRSDSANQQAAVMLYVHSLMGDAAPGEIDPGALTPESRSIYRTVRRDVKRYAGPYSVRATLPDQLVAGRAAEVRVQVLGAAGRAVPDVELELGATGATACPDRQHRRRGDRDGQAHADRSERGAQVSVRAPGLAADVPVLYARPGASRAERAAPGRARGNGGARRSERAGQGGAAGRHADQRPVGRARLRDHRHGQGQRARRADRDRAGRALRPVPGAREITCTDTPVWTGSSPPTPTAATSPRRSS